MTLLVSLLIRPPSQPSFFFLPHPGLTLVAVVYRLIMIQNSEGLLLFVVFFPDLRRFVAACRRWSVHLVKVGHGSQDLSSKYDVISLMAININTLSVADGLEANVMEPANRGTKRDSSGKVRWQVRGGEEMFVQPDAKLLSGHVGLAFLEIILPHPLRSFLVQLFIFVDHHSIVLALSSLI